MSPELKRLQQIQELIHRNERLYQIYGDEMTFILLQSLKKLYHNQNIQYLRSRNPRANKKAPAYLTVIYNGDETIDAVLGISS